MPVCYKTNIETPSKVSVLFQRAIFLSNSLPTLVSASPDFPVFTQSLLEAVKITVSFLYSTNLSE